MSDIADMLIPGMIAGVGTNTSTVTSITIDQTGDAAEWVFMAEEDDTITHLGFRYSAKGAGTPPQYTIALKDVTSGSPGSTTFASNTFTPPNDSSWNGTWQWIALSSSYAITKNTKYSITISTAGTPNSDIFGVAMPTGVAVYNWPAAIVNNNGSRSRQSQVPLFAYKSATKTYGFPAATFTNVSTNDSSLPDENGIAFNLDGGIGDTYQIAGAVIIAAVSATTGNVNVSLETTGGTVLATGALTKADISSTARRLVRFLLNGTLPTLSFGTEYYLWFKSDDTANFQPSSFNLPAAGDANPIPGGSMFAYVTRDNGGSPTKDTTRRMIADLILADLTEPVGGGSTYVFNLEG
jgi:hypothetical protein